MSLVSTLTTGVSGGYLPIPGPSTSSGITSPTSTRRDSKVVRPCSAICSATSISGGTLTSQVGKGAQLLGSLQSFEQGAFENSTNAHWTWRSTATDSSSSTTVRR